MSKVLKDGETFNTGVDEKTLCRDQIDSRFCGSVNVYSCQLRVWRRYVGRYGIRISNWGGKR